MNNYIVYLISLCLFILITPLSLDLSHDSPFFFETNETQHNPYTMTMFGETLACGSFQEYLATRLSQLYTVHTITQSQDNSSLPLVLILVHSSLLPAINDELMVYTSSFFSRFYTTVILEVSGGTVEDIKTTIQTYYYLEEKLVGVILIGNHSTAWFHHEDDFEGPDEFPCDLFLMDLDGEWVDSDSDRMYDLHSDGTGDTAPEIYLGRIDASRIPGDEIASIQQYLSKVSEYWEGTLPHTNIGLTYTDRDWAQSSQHRYGLGYAYDDYQALWYPNVNRDDYAFYRLPNETYEFIQISCHAGHTTYSHHFEIGGYLYSDDVRAAGPQALFYNLFTCGSLRFTDENCLGNAYILNTSSPSLTVVGSTKVGSMLNFRFFYEPIGEDHASFGQAFQQWFEYMAPYNNDDISWYYGMTILGDPTLFPHLPWPDIVYIDDDYNDSVEGWGYDRFTRIQKGITAVAEQGTVVVHEGTYDEHLSVQKPLTLRSAPLETAVINGSGSGNIIGINSDFVTISGLVIHHGSTGVYVLSNHNTIENTTIIDTNQGIHLWWLTQNNTLLSNTIYSFEDNGIYVEQSSYNLLCNNRINTCGSTGMYLTDSHHNTISGNLITDCTFSGIILINAESNSIFENSMKNNNYGLFSVSTNNHMYHNNFCCNTINAIDSGVNTWYNTDLSEGNFWSDYDGVDDNDDGIGDTPHSISGGENQDEYPLMNTLILGDIDNDCDVDQSDLGILLAAWDSYPGDPNWNPNADLDGDNYVGQSDLGLLLGNWGHEI